MRTVVCVPAKRLCVENRVYFFSPNAKANHATAPVQDLNRTEIFFVEGDSAGGSAKQARDREFQAVMPLRGKILNTWEVSADPGALASQEVHDISVALGIDPDNDDLSGLRYGKICILADADSMDFISRHYYVHYSLVTSAHLLKRVISM